MLLGAPREIRDRIYDYVFDCDSEDPVELHPVEWHAARRGDYRTRLLLPIGSGDLKLTDEALALLHVNHQISNEAACHLYGKRTFSGNSRDFLMFLRGIGQCRKLVRKVQIFEHSSNADDHATHLHDLISDLSTLGTLKLFRFVMVEDQYSYRSVYQSLIDRGVHKLGCELEVRNGGNRSFVRRGLSPDNPTRTVVRFSKHWTCAKDSLEWKGGELHCQTLAWLSPESLNWVPVPEPRIKLCNHIHEDL